MDWDSRWLVDLSLEVSVLGLLFSVLWRSLLLGLSAPIWLQVWARRASGLFFASSYKQEGKLN